MLLSFCKTPVNPRKRGMTSPVLVVVTEVTRRPVFVMSSVKMITMWAQWTTYVVALAALALKVGWMLAGQATVESF